MLLADARKVQVTPEFFIFMDFRVENGENINLVSLNSGFAHIGP